MNSTLIDDVSRANMVRARVAVASCLLTCVTVAVVVAFPQLVPGAACTT
jgi:hypothetical protein